MKKFVFVFSSVMFVVSSLMVITYANILSPGDVLSNETSSTTTSTSAFNTTTRPATDDDIEDDNDKETTTTTTRAVVARGSSQNTTTTTKQPTTQSSSPAPVDCVVSSWSSWSLVSLTPETCPIEQIQTKIETRSRTILTNPSNGGAACPILTETRTTTPSCNFVVNTLVTLPVNTINEGLTLNGNTILGSPLQGKVTFDLTASKALPANILTGHSVLINGNSINTTIRWNGTIPYIRITIPANEEIDVSVYWGIGTAQTKRIIIDS